MIKIEITRTGDRVKTNAEFDINSTRMNAKIEFERVMRALKDADKKLFHEVLKVFVCEHIDEMIGELEDNEHDD